MSTPRFRQDRDKESSESVLPATEHCESVTATEARVVTERRLLVRDEVISILHLTDDQVQQLINTRQILPIRIAGEERFDSQDLYRLIETYKFTAARRPK